MHVKLKPVFVKLRDSNQPAFQWHTFLVHVSNLAGVPLTCPLSLRKIQACHPTLGKRMGGQIHMPSMDKWRNGHGYARTSFKDLARVACKRTRANYNQIKA